MNGSILNIKVADSAGFCFGVKRALDIAFSLGRQYPDQVFTLGPIIHNPQVVKELENNSVHMVQDLKEIKEGIMIVRSHGLPPRFIEEAKNKGLKVIDATCPFVKKVQTYALSLKKEGYPVLLVGDEDHPEVLAIKGYIKNEIMICQTEKQLESIKFPKKIGIVAQTTQDYKNFKKIVAKLLDRVTVLKIYNTICDSTIVRQKSASKLAKRADIMIVIGGRNSANTNRLAFICSSINKKTYLIETENELNKDWFNNISNIGITAGASTPKWIIDKVIEKIKTF